MAGSYALTPPGRLQAMTNRVAATLEAVRTVRPALESFYDSHSDEQKARFNELGPNVGDPRQAAALGPGRGEQLPRGKTRSDQPADRADRGQCCGRAARRGRRSTTLAQATAKAVEVLQSACPDDVPLTPVGRLEAMEQRLDAMLKAAALVQQPLEAFYGTLSADKI